MSGLCAKEYISAVDKFLGPEIKFIIFIAFIIKTNSTFNKTIKDNINLQITIENILGYQDIINLLNNKRPVIYGNGLKRRDYIYVDDINHFHEFLINDNTCLNDTFNFENISIYIKKKNPTIRIKTNYINVKYPNEWFLHFNWFEY